MGIASLLNGTFGLFFSWSLLHIPPFILSFLSPHRKSHSSSVQVFTCLWPLLCLSKAGGLPPAIVPGSLISMWFLRSSRALSISSSQSLFSAQMSHDTPSFNTWSEVALSHCFTVFTFLAYLCFIIGLHYLNMSGDIFAPALYIHWPSCRPWLA